MPFSGTRVVGNYVSYLGGGIYNDYSGKLTIQSSSYVGGNWYYDLYNLDSYNLGKKKSNVIISTDSTIGSTYGL